MPHLNHDGLPNVVPVYINVYFYTWKLDTGQAELIKRIGKALDNILGEVTNKSIIEIISYGKVVHNEGWGIVFDHIDKVIDETEGQIIELPNLSLLTNKPENKNFRIAATESLDMLAKAMTGYTPLKTTKIEIQTQEGHTISKEKSDFNISEREIDYIKKVRDLLQCSSVKITKGDLVVELK